MLGFRFQLWSHTFSFRPVWTFGCSPAFMILALVNTRQHPVVILVNAAARQLYGFALIIRIYSFFSVRHVPAVHTKVYSQQILI